MNKKILLFSLLGLISITSIVLYFTLFYKNLVIINNDSIPIRLDDKYLGNSKKISLNSNIGTHYLWATEKELKIIRVGVFKTEIEVTKPELNNVTGFDSTEMTPGMADPVIKDGNILYLGGRELNTLLSFNLSGKERSRISEKDFQGARNIKWNQNREQVIIFLDPDTYLSPIFSESKSLVWLFNITNDSLTPLDFIAADFINDDIVGWKEDGSLSSYNGSEYIKLKNFKSTSANVSSAQNTIISWDNKNILIAQEGEKDVKKQFKNINTASISADGSRVAISGTSNKDEEVIFFDLNQKKTVSFPFKAVSLKWQGNDILIFKTSDALWKIDFTNLKATNLFTRKENLPIGEYFTDNNNIYFRHRGELNQIKL